MVLTVSFVLFSVTGLCCHRRLRMTPQICRQRRGVRTTRLRRPRSASFVFSKPPRPLHPVPNVRDDRDTPLLRAGMIESVELFLANREAENF
jgi:hypothetical protein